MHGHDERVPITALDFATRFVYDVVWRMARPA